MMTPDLFGPIPEDCTVDVGAELNCQSSPDLVLKDASKLLIGDDVTIRRDVDLWATGGSEIILESGVKLDRGVRVLAANGSSVRIGEGSAIGIGSVINGGDFVTIGRLCLISGYVYVQTSMHRHEQGTPIRHQGFDHAPIIIGDDVWIGAHATVFPGCNLASGTIIGSSAVMRESSGSDEIWAGVPARPVGRR